MWRAVYVGWVGGYVEGCVCGVGRWLCGGLCMWGG